MAQLPKIVTCATFIENTKNRRNLHFRQNHANTLLGLLLSYAVLLYRKQLRGIKLSNDFPMIFRESLENHWKVLPV